MFFNRRTSTKCNISEFNNALHAHMETNKCFILQPSHYNLCGLLCAGVLQNDMIYSGYLDLHQMQTKWSLPLIALPLLLSAEIMIHAAISSTVILPTFLVFNAHIMFDTYNSRTFIFATMLIDCDDRADIHLVTKYVHISNRKCR